eukprot:5534277-Prymnesium_polylepis.1
MPAMPIQMLLKCRSMRLTPDTRWDSHSPCWSARTAECIATSEAEHAVSNEQVGPCKPNVNAVRPDAMESAAPVAT